LVQEIEFIWTLPKPGAASLPAPATMLRSGSRGLFYIAKPYLLLLDIPPNSRLSNGLRAASVVLRLAHHRALSRMVGKLTLGPPGGLSTSLRANGRAKCAPVDGLREAIHFSKARSHIITSQHPTAAATLRNHRWPGARQAASVSERCRPGGYLPFDGAPNGGD
jgi:hypothetical protein